MAKEAMRIDITIDAKDKTDPGISSAQRKMTAFDKTNEKLVQRLNKLNSSKWRCTIEAVDKVTGVIAKIGSTVKGLVGKAWSFTVSVIDKVTAPVRSMISKLGELLSVGTAVSAVIGGITLKDMLGASSAQNKVEKQLETVLANVSDAEDAMDRLKAKASSLQSTTMYGDETYLAGAAELATYLSDTEALEKAMEVLSDYAAGMSGGDELSIEEMVNYATQLGKALNGPDAAFDGLTKKGFAFSEAQEEILKSDLTSDMEKISVLAEVIGESWDGLAEAFANTPTARVTQFKNAWGDMKEVIGDKLYPSVGNLFKMLTTKIPGVQKLLERGADWLSAKIEKSIPVIDGWIDSGIAKLEEFADLAESVFESEEFQNADFLGKVSIAWDRLIAQPFSEWWDKTGRAWFADKMSKVGEGIGTGLTTGLVALLGIDISDAVNDGESVGAAFIQGFKKGFDTEKVTQALKEWAENNKEVVIAVGAIVGFNLVTGIAGKINDLTSLFKKQGNNLGDLSTNCTTATVNGNIVNVYGKTVNSSGGSGDAAKKAMDYAKSFVTSAGGAAAGKALLSGGSAAATGKALLGAGGSPAGLLTSGKAAGTAAAGASSAAGGAVGSLASLGSAVGGTASTTAGMAAIGAGAAGGVAAGVGTLVSAGIDVYEGIQAAEAGEERKAREEYITAGTKVGIAGLGAGGGALAGAAIGAAGGPIGAGAGALIGLFIGGLGAMFGGDDAGKAIADATYDSGHYSSGGVHHGGSGGKYAWGGIVNSPHMAMVAEDGAEAIIPLSSGKRQRGISLWEDAGESLGVSASVAPGVGGGNVVEVNVSVSPEFVIEARDAGFDGESLVSVVREHIREMADDIGDEIADRLARVFSNMPVKGSA